MRQPQCLARVRSKLCDGVGHLLPQSLLPNTIRWRNKATKAVGIVLGIGPTSLTQRLVDVVKLDHIIFRDVVTGMDSSLYGGMLVRGCILPASNQSTHVYTTHSNPIQLIFRITKPSSVSSHNALSCSLTSQSCMLQSVDSSAATTNSPQNLKDLCPQAIHQLLHQRQQILLPRFFQRAISDLATIQRSCHAPFKSRRGFQGRR